MKKLIFLLFLMHSFIFSQNLEETIYVATETFISNQNNTTFQNLENEENTFKNIVKTKDEQLALVFLQSHKGYYLDKNSKFEKAILTYEEILNRFNKNKLASYSDFDIIENCLKPLGNLYTKTDDFTNAINIINQYIYLAEINKNTTHLISGAINLAKLYYTLGRHDKVFETVKKFIATPNINNDQKQKLIQINIDSEIANNNSGNQDFIASSNKNYHFYNIYKLELKKKDYNAALDAFKIYKTHQLKDSLSTRYLSLLYIEEAQLYYKLNNSNKALTSLKQATKVFIPSFKTNSLPNKDELYAENKFIDIFDLYAEIETNSEIALQCFDFSFYVSNLLKNNWTSQETKIINENNNRIRAEKCINILYDAYKQTKNKDYLIRALQYSENNKGAILKDMALKKKRLQKQPNDSLLTKEFNLLKRQESLTNLLVKEKLAKNRASEINILSIQLNQISYQIKALKSTITKKYFNQKNIISLKTLKNKLQEDHAILVEYFYGQNNIYQFIISNNSIELNQIHLNPNIKEHILKFIHLFDNPSIINNNITNYTNLAFRLYKDLNFNAILDNKQVLLIPDGLLNFIPFESLLTRKTETTSFSKMPFVVSNQNIAYNTNLFFYLTNSKPKKKNKTLGLFPVFENTNQSLTYSINEAEVIKNEMPSNIFMRNKATKSNFIENASKYNILHLSTHASGGNSITPASISFYDKTMLLNELNSLNLNAELAVLSACETGIGTLYKAEGPMSIARGFQFAGTKNLLFSLWQINDLSTSQIMQFFYKNFNSTQSAFIANHRSKIKYLQSESITNDKKSPYYWSAFVYYGVLSPSDINTTNFFVYILFGILIVFIVVLLMLKLKKHDRNSSKFPSK